MGDSLDFGPPADAEQNARDIDAAERERRRGEPGTLGHARWLRQVSKAMYDKVRGMMAEAGRMEAEADRIEASHIRPLSYMGVYDVGTFLDGPRKGRRFIVEDRRPEYGASGVTKVIIDGYGPETFVWDSHNPPVRREGKGKITTAIDWGDS
jgi:hypothetical protein